MDCKASEHVVSGRSYLKNIQQISPITVELADVTSITTTLKGKVEVNTDISGVKITNAYYIPALKINILSCKRLDEHGVISKI